MYVLSWMRKDDADWGFDFTPFSYKECIELYFTDIETIEKFGHKEEDFEYFITEV